MTRAYEYASNWRTRSLALAALTVAFLALPAQHAWAQG
jgi:hypothetical protein